MRRLSTTVLVLGLVAACSGDGVSDTTTFNTSPVPETTTSAAVDPPTTTSTSQTSTTITATLAAQESSVAILVAGPVPAGHIAATATADGYPLLTYVASDGSLQLVQCRDVACDEPVSETTLGYPGEAAWIDLAMLPDGSPVVVVQPWASKMAHVYLCSDSSCTSIETAELADPDPCIYADGNPCQFLVDYPSIVVASDGLPRVVYLTNTNPRKVKVASCQTTACGFWDLKTIDQLPPDTGSGALSVHNDDDDRLLVGYWFSYASTGGAISRIAVCEDPSCSDVLTIISINGSVFPQTTTSDISDTFLAWHQTGDAALPVTTADPSDNFALLWSDYSDFMVSACTANGCAEPRRVEVGEDWLLAQGAGSLRLFTARDGSTGAFFNHASRAESAFQLHFTQCTDASCTEGTTATVGVDTIDGPFFDVIASSIAPPQVVFMSIDGTIRLLSCGAASCSP